MGISEARAAGRRALWRGIQSVCATAAALIGAHPGSAQVIQPNIPNISISGGITVPTNNIQIQNQFTWLSEFEITGSRFPGNVFVPIHIVGPLNSPGTPASDHQLTSLISDARGNIIGVAGIPYTLGSAANSPVLQPGNYQVYAGPVNLSGGPFNAIAPANINICPRTVAYPSVMWSLARGGRDGQVGDASPEREDPEWVSVWDDKPVAFYATVAATGLDGDNQPSFISHHDYPGTHFGHDVNLELVPDPAYLWLLADANYNDSNTNKAEYGRIELEWETQNAGSPASQGGGVIGLPLWATPTAGDRVYAVGRWVMDNGHPDVGDRTEIHPARALATMRKRNTVTQFGSTAAMTRASQVDLYVSGHGGGANMYPDLLDQTIGSGGNLFFFLDNADYQTYTSFGPSTSTIAALLTSYLGGQASLIQAVAGPSGLDWFNGPEFRPVDDMDYQIDVPLPPAPPGATQPQVRVITHGEHTTSVREFVSYTNTDPATGLPTTAHITLPYLGVDNGTYARTLLFSWNAFSPPGEHFSVRVRDVKLAPVSVTVAGIQVPALNPSSWNFFADLSGQWFNLTRLNPSGFSSPAWGGTIGGLAGADAEVYVDPSDSIRLFARGYEARTLESLFGAEVGKPAYQVGVDIVEASFGATGRLAVDDDANLSGSLAELAPTPASAGSPSVPAASTGYTFTFSGAGIGIPDFRATLDLPLYSVDYDVTFIPSPGRIVVTGAPISFGSLCIGTSSTRTLQLSNPGESPLVVAGIVVSGAGFRLGLGAPTGAFVIQPGQTIGIPVEFAPTATTQGTGSIAINSSDPAQPSLTYALSGGVLFPTIAATAATNVTPTLVVGATKTWPVTVRNAGDCFLTVRPEIAGTGFSLSGLPRTITGGVGPIVLPGGASYTFDVNLVVQSTATKIVGVLTLRNNDPSNPAPTATFGAEGVPVGMRVLVVQPDGTPYTVVDSIHLTSDGRPKTNVHLHDVPLTTINPPQSWKTIQYHYMTALPPTGTGHDQPHEYRLRVRVGHDEKEVTFTLADNEFNQITITLP